MTCPEKQLREALEKASPYVYAISKIHARSNKECSCKDCRVGEQVVIALALPPCPHHDPIREAEKEVVAEAMRLYDSGFFIGGHTKETELSDALTRLALAQKTGREGLK